MAHYFVLNNASLKRYNTLRLEAIAEIVILPHSIEGMVAALRDYNDRRIVLIGNGSNIVFSQEYYDESTVFIVTILLNDISINNDELIVETGGRLTRLAWFACEQSLGGMAFCEDIPGTMGGALIMNAGQWQFSIGQYVNWIEVYNYETDTVDTIVPDVDFFSYRHSKLTQMPVYILRCGLRTVPGNYNEVLKEMLYYRHERYVKQPRNYANAGSVFKRPMKDGETLFVWKLFDGVDLRGYRVGDAMVSDKHPGFIVNVNQASIPDILNVIGECIQRVKERYDVDLELEWIVI